MLDSSIHFYMRKESAWQKINLVATIMITGLASQAQQQFTQIVTTQNRNCNSVCSVLDIPALANNTAAIILATPVTTNGVNPNPHPFDAYYMYLNKWSIHNLDGTAIGVGALFKVEYRVNRLA